jgi:hypothetical protein
VEKINQKPGMPDKIIRKARLEIKHDYFLLKKAYFVSEQLVSL